MQAAPGWRIDPDELAVLLKRAKGLLAIGDITSARLLELAGGDAQGSRVTWQGRTIRKLVQYLRSVTPDPDAARVWYQKAAQMGSADAKRLLGQLQN